MNIKIVSKVLSAIIGYIGIIIISLPAIFAIIFREHSDTVPFFAAGVFAFLIAGLLNLSKVKAEELSNVKKLDAIAIIFFGWTLFGIICAVPYLFYNLSIIDSLFESFSGVTSCGATIFVDYSLYPKTLFFFRSLTQWLGGLGIIVMFIAILPKFAIAGRQVFFADLPGLSDENITPRIRHTVSWLWGIYIILTLVQMLLLKYLGGMDFYHAICNSLSTISSGGFSPNPDSIAGYGSNIVNWITMIFMFLAGMSFVLLYRILVQGKIASVLRNQEFKIYVLIIFAAGLFLAKAIYAGGEYSASDALTHGYYQALSIITTTGSASTDYYLWNKSAKAIMFVCMFIGGCVSSTSGGIKMARWILVFQYLKREIQRIVHPRGVYLIKYNGKVIEEDSVSQVMAFVIFFFIFYGVSAFLVAYLSRNPPLTLSGSIATLANVGPGFGPIIGPMGNYSVLPAALKCVFIFNMLVGRLELIPFLAFLHRDMWKKY